MAEALDVGLPVKNGELGTGNGERLEESEISSPKAERAAAEYLPLDLEPTVVPSMSLKYEVPFEDATGLPPPT